MYAIRSFGRRHPHAAFLGDATSAPAPTPSCDFTRYLGDETNIEGSVVTHGTVAAITAVALVGVGWFVGGMVPVVGRPVGSLVAAGVAGAVTYAGFAKWKTDGGTLRKPGSCP